MAGQLAIGLLALLLVLSFLAAPPAEGPPGAGRFPIVGQPAPPFTLRGLSGEWSLAEHLGKPLVIAFWTTWCGACVKDLDILEGFHRRYGDQVEVVAVCPEHWAKVPRVVAEHPVGFPVLYDPGARVTARYELLDNLRYPFTVFVDARGTVTGVWAVALRDLDQLLELLSRSGIKLSG